MQGRHYYIEQEGQREVKTVLGDMGNYTLSPNAIDMNL